MRQIPINQAKSIIKQLLKVKRQQKISLLTNKKDRSLTIIVNDGEVTVKEQGYVNDINTYSTESTAKHELTRAFKREFPRSHQLYISYE
ncbi:hypothetical protein HUK45_05185 [Limosilactobacillus sp. c9Ua_26_M]|uniref:Uncharacterized protein n=1 Tax=Limosilactobacillus urinaemulieris TaxID=2742600 RepID=A0ABR8ZK49_9LACO|nr:hypothetical protein [Limosilactobacillus urinaemulieris]MBD8085641.1 hypothetical protein [Limosilactobacillus urinaemulieris]